MNFVSAYSSSNSSTALIRAIFEVVYDETFLGDEFVPPPAKKYNRWLCILHITNCHALVEKTQRPSKFASTPLLHSSMSQSPNLPSGCMLPGQRTRTSQIKLSSIKFCAALSIVTLFEITIVNFFKF